MSGSNQNLTPPSANLGVSAGGAWTSLRTHFSATHAISAVQLAAEATERERAAQDPNPALNEVRALATGAILIAVGFLEATINEFFLDLVEGKSPTGWDALPEEKRKLAATLWETASIERLPATAKFDAALEIFGRSALAGTHFQQGADLAIDVRNALIHARPVTHSDLPGESTKLAVRLSKRLDGRFARNRFMGNNEAFPDGVLGGGGARWAFRACIDFTDEFFRRLGVAPRYQAFRERFEVEDPLTP